MSTKIEVLQTGGKFNLALNGTQMAEFFVGVYEDGRLNLDPVTGKYHGGAEDKDLLTILQYGLGDNFIVIDIGGDFYKYDLDEKGDLRCRRVRMTFVLEEDEAIE